MVIRQWYSKFNLRKKLTIAFTIAGIMPLIIVASISLYSAQSYLTEQAEEQLQSVMKLKQRSLEYYFANIMSQVKTVSARADIVAAMEAFSSGYDLYLEQVNYPYEYEAELSQYYKDAFGQKFTQLNNGKQLDSENLLRKISRTAKALQIAYISNNPSALGEKDELLSVPDGSDYSLAHQRYHPDLQRFLREFGFYDLFLIDNNTGRVVYSVFKELDYATSLIDGPYSDSGLALAFKKSLELPNSNDFFLTDFYPYIPSYGAPASFIASPIEVNGKRIGTLVFQMPLDRISAVMSSRDGLGRSGETYLVGSDMLMRSDSTKDPENFSVIQSFRQPGKGAVNSWQAEQALAGDSGVIVGKNYLNEAVVAAYTPINIGGVTWAMLVETEVQEAFAAITALQIIYLIVGGVAILALVGLAWLLSGSIVRPTLDLVEGMKNVRTHWDFNTRIKVNSTDEVGQAGAAFNDLMQSLQQVIFSINQVMGAVASGDFSVRVEENLEGDLERLKQSINCSTDSIAGTLLEIVEVMKHIEQGNFKVRASTVASGQLEVLRQRVNAAAEICGQVIDDAVIMMSAMASGDLTRTSELHLCGEYAKLRDSLLQTNHKLREIVEDIGGAVTAVTSTVNEITEEAGELEKRTELQAQNVENIVVTMADMAKFFKKNAKNMEESSELSVQAVEQANNSQFIVLETIKSMDDICEASAKIGDIVSVVNEIAFQINQLAVNASIEAARAGEQGRGFVVVANEVRDLSQRSAGAVREIEVLIENSVDKVKVGSGLVNNSGEIIKDIIGFFEQVNGGIAEVTKTISEQVSGVKQVSSSIKHMESVTQQNAELARELSRRCEQMKQLGEELDYKLKQFKI